MILIVLTAALALAPGLESAVQTRDLPSISTYPINLEEPIQIQTLPGLLIPVEEGDTVITPELRPEPASNPCDACFEYMTSLIEQLSGVPEGQLPESVPEIEAHPMPEIAVIPEGSPGGSVGVGPRPLGPLVIY